MTQPVRSESPAARLRVVDSAAPDLAGREIGLTGPTAWIGRSADCDLVVADASVSRRHAHLELLADGSLKVTDNNSANGLFVSGKRVSEAQVLPGQRFSVGGTTFELVREEPALEVAPSAEDAEVSDRTVAISGLGELAAAFAGEGWFAEQGESVVTAANRPFLLSDPTSMWVVESGKVEIFTVAVENGQPVGARTHFLSVEPGQGFFGLDTDRYGYDSGFLAVGKAGSHLRRYSLDQAHLLATVPAHRERVANLVSTWVTGLSKRLVHDLPSVPDADLLLRAGEKAELAAEKIAAAHSAAVWLEMPGGHFLFDGMASLSYEVEGVFFPLGPGSWLEPLTSGETIPIEPRSTEDAVADPRLWAGLEAFHRVLCECEFLNKRLAVVDEYNRLQRKAEQSEAAREAAVGAIESVLGGTEMWQRPSLAGGELGTVFRACSEVGEAMGIEVEKPPEVAEELSFEETVQAVATASRFRTRRIALADEWWNQDQGPMLGQWEETKQAVAILPKGPKAYEVVDPVSGDRQRVTAEVASALEPFALTFYRPFPDGPLTARSLIRFGLKGLGPEMRQVGLMGAGIGMLGTVTPFITGLVFDTAIPEAERGMLIQFSLGILLVALATAAFKITQNIAMLRVQGKMDYSVQAAVWDRLMDLPIPFFRSFSAGDLADRAAGVDHIRAIIAGAGVAAMLGSVASIFNVIQMGIYSLTLAAMGVGLTLLYVLLTVAANVAQLRLQRMELQRMGRIAGMVLQLIGGVAKLRVSGAENHAFRVWATEFSGARKVSFAVGKIQNLVAVLNAGFPVFSSMVIFFTLATLKKGALERGEVFTLSTGDFLAFSAAYGIFVGAMQAMGEASVNMLKIIPVYERLQPILTADSEVDGTKAHPGRLKGGIELSHVWFRYAEDSPWVIKDLSLKIEPGQFVAFVGGSGCGKSTLMRLMLGFEKPERGAVYYDGQDLSTLDLRLVRQQLGVVLQESRLLPADIYRNIVGASSRTVAEAWEAAAKAGIADDIKGMPMGMHTYVMEGGGGFSGGQKQRLMIARALVHNPKIIYLDEATSALDNRTQAIVTESMDRLAATRVVIAHRLSTIVGAHIICYLEAGAIKEQGTYQELMEKDGAFAELARRQLA